MDVQNRPRKLRRVTSMLVDHVVADPYVGGESSHRRTLCPSQRSPGLLIRLYSLQVC